MTDLFTIPESKPSALELARIRMDKAQKAMDEANKADPANNDYTPEDERRIWQELSNATAALRDAERDALKQSRPRIERPE